MTTIPANTPPKTNTRSQVSSNDMAEAGSKTVDYDSFLKLLIAQMKNQDPTNPTDATQYVSQLASFSSVEQQVKTNAKLDSLLNTSALSQAGVLIGRTLTANDGATSGIVKTIGVEAGVPYAVLENGTQVALSSNLTLS